jgi:hypothetical protein
LPFAAPLTTNGGSSFFFSSPVSICDGSLPFVSRKTATIARPISTNGIQLNCADETRRVLRRGAHLFDAYAYVFLHVTEKIGLCRAYLRDGILRFLCTLPLQFGKQQQPAFSLCETV